MTTIGDLFDLTPEPWMSQALCAEIGGDDWFPDHGASAAAAVAVCAICEMKTKCLQWALKNNEPFGVWGGLTERERRRITGRRRAA